MSKPNLTCPNARELEEYFEETLTPRRRAAVAAHLEQCDACAAELVQIERLASAVAALPQAEPGAELLEAIAAGVAGLPSPGERRGLLTGWRRVGVLAGVFVAAMAGLRYGFPLLWPKLTAAAAPAIAWLGLKGALAIAWLYPKLDAAEALLRAIWKVVDALGAAALATSPTIALYAVGEIALIVGMVLLFRWTRPRAPAAARLFLM